MSLSMPLFVTVPVSGWVQLQEAPQTASSDPKWADMVVGVLPDWKINAQPDWEAASRDLGKPVNVFTSQVKCDKDYVSCITAFAVRCETMEEAMALPGFTQVFSYSGKYPIDPLKGG